jgi:hypothetical protein
MLQMSDNQLVIKGSAQITIVVHSFFAWCAEIKHTGLTICLHYSKQELLNVFG